MQFHLSELSNIGKANNRETTEDEAIQYLKKASSKLKENEFHNPAELEILENLLPQMASADEVRAHIFMLEAEQGLDISNKGAVMKAVKAKFGALVDMKMVQGML
jgi:uncharacterized protein YqeY